MHFGQIWANRSSCTSVRWTLGQAEAGCWILENWTNFSFYFQFTLSHKQLSSSVSSVFHPKVFSQPKSGTPSSRTKPFNEIWRQSVADSMTILFLWITIGTVIKENLKFETWISSICHICQICLSYLYQAFHTHGHIHPTPLWENWSGFGIYQHRRCSI